MIRQDITGIFVDSEFLIVVPGLLSVEVGVTNHDLIPELFVIPISFHFTEHFHELVLSPVNKFKMVFWVLEDFKDHVIELNVVSSITPLFDCVVTVWTHLNHDLDTFVWDTGFSITSRGNDFASFGFKFSDLFFEILDLDIMLILQRLGELFDQSFFLFLTLKSLFVNDLLFS